MTKPLPCPFCGGTLVTVIVGETHRWRLVECACGARGPDARVQTIGEGTKEQWEAKGRENAIAAWNQRSVLQQPTEPK